MSSIPAYRWIPDVLNINKQRKWAFTVSNSAFAQYIFPANSTNTQNIQVNCDIPVNAVMSRICRIQLPCQLTFTGTSTSGNLLNYGLYDALRQGAFEQILSSQDATINGTKVSYQPYIVYQPLQRYAQKEVQDGLLCTEPMYPDYFQEYSQSNQYGFSTDPLGTRGNNERPLRGAFNVNVVSNTSSSAVVTFTIEALISVPPFDVSNKPVSGLVGLNKVIFNFQTTGNFYRMWSHNPASPSTISSTAMIFTSPPQVVTWLYQPAQEVAPYLGGDYTYDYSLLGPTVSTAGLNVNAGASATIQSQNFNLDGIPTGLLVWVAENPSNWSISTSDVAARITQLNVTWETFQNLLATASEYDLYHMSKANAFNQSWVDFDNYCGSYVMLVPGKDFPLPVGQVIGMGGKRTFQIQAQIVNIGTRTINYYLNVLPIYAGVINISQGSALTQTNPLTESAVRGANNLPIVDKEALEISGGSFFKDVGSFITEKVLPIASSVGRISKVFRGSGSTGGRMGRMRGMGMANKEETCDNQNDCGHQECQGRGGCLECQQEQEQEFDDTESEASVELPQRKQGSIDKDLLRKQLLGNGFSKQMPKPILKKPLLKKKVQREEVNEEYQEEQEDNGPEERQYV